jgi:SAM-dependent methyltransferase
MHSTSNSTTNRYGSIAAEIYDIDKPFGALPDTAFYLERLAGIKGPILEPACGSGRTLAPLSQAGHEVVGFDPSVEMLDRCRTRCAEGGFSAQLSRQRFEDFQYDATFAAIIVPVGSFTLVDDFAAALAVLGRFRDHLGPGGVLLVDIQPLSFLAASGEDRRRWVADNGDMLTLEGKRTATDWLGQRVESIQRYERWRDNALVEAQLEPMAQRYWGLGEFTLALERAGFAAVSAWGGYDRQRAPRAGDRVLTFEARRN